MSKPSKANYTFNKTTRVHYKVTKEYNEIKTQNCSSNITGIAI